MVMEAKKKAKTAQVQNCFSVSSLCHNVTSSVKYSKTSLNRRLDTGPFMGGNAMFAPHIEVT